MIEKSLVEKVYKTLLNEPTIEKGYDFYSCLGETDDLHEWNLKVQKVIKSCMKSAPKKEINDWYELYVKSLKYGSKRYFEQYLLYMEIDRPAEERFYSPRKKTMKRVVDALQRLVDGELDELFLSMPPRVGKSTILVFFATWIAGRFPLSSNLYSSYSDTLTKSFYNGLLEVMKDNLTYHWEECFDEQIVKVNAQYQTVNVRKKLRYPTFTCRSIDGTLNGACDCSGIMIADDLCSGIEEAMSKDRLASLWLKVSNDLLSRCKKGSKKVWCGTRWSINDPIGVRLSHLEGTNVRYEVVNLPALDDKGESNFDYKHNVGFDTEAYHQIRSGFEKNNDMASWSAQYMGDPIEREGALLSSGDLRYYNGYIPEGYVSIFMACDPAWGGGDFVASPVCMKIEEDVFVPDVVYTNEDKKKSIPKIVDKIAKYQVMRIQIEANKMTEGFADAISEELKRRGIKCTVTTKPAPTTTSKEQRIFDKAPDIREHFVFLSSDKRSKEYQSFMDNVFSFTINGKNKHDDAPDSLAMASDMAFKPVQTAQTFKRFI